MAISLPNSLTKRNLFAPLIVLAICLIGANFAVAFLTRHSLPRQSMAMIANSPGASYVLLGNSLLVVGFDAAEFNSQLKIPSKETLNLAMTSTGQLEHLLFLRYALVRGISPRVLIYGFADLQLSEPFSLKNSDLIGKREVIYYLEPEYAKRFCNLSTRDTIEFELMRRSAMFSERSAVWRRVELMRRKLAEQGMPKTQENRLGRVADFSLLEAANPAEFSLLVDAASNSPLNAPVAEILREGVKSGARVIFVEMPMSSEHRARFYNTDSWRRYRFHVQSILASQGAIYIDASEWIPDDTFFMDNIHLNDAGAAKFSRKLAESLPQQLPRLFPADSSAAQGNGR